MSIEYKVERYKKVIIERELGYLPVEKVVDFQRLVKVTDSWFGPIKTVIDFEEIPAHVIVSLGCFGDTGGWRSKFAQYIK